MAVVEIVIAHEQLTRESRIVEFDMSRSQRLHWIRHHVEQRKLYNMLHFSVAEPRSTRTYIYDVDEKYVIVLEPRRNGTAYYLLTAYHLEEKDAARNKIISKYNLVDYLHSYKKQKTQSFKACVSRFPSLK